MCAPCCAKSTFDGQAWLVLIPPLGAETRVCSGGAERDSRSERSAPAAAFIPLRCIDISVRSCLESELMAAGPLASEGDSKQREEQFDLRECARFRFLFLFS